LVFKDLKAI